MEGIADSSVREESDPACKSPSNLYENKTSESIQTIPVQVDTSPPKDDGSDGRQYGPNYFTSSNNPSLRQASECPDDDPPSPKLPHPTPESIPQDILDWLNAAKIANQQDLETVIREINKKQALSQCQKNLMNQLAHQKRITPRLERQSQQLKEQFDKSVFHVSKSKVVDPKTGQFMLGCDHYPRNCKLKAACCETWVVCRQCHDRDDMGHQMPRHETKEVMCMLCGHVQPVAKACVKCHQEFAHYFCSICKFYDNTPGKSIYHCPDCGICRVGRGLDIDNFHCKRCDACVSKDYKDNHRCLKKSLDANCPICGQYLYTSTKPVVFMRCGHTMHSHCFDAYTADNFTCPLCHKTLTNMTPYYRQLDDELANHEMPKEHRDMVTEILCHDCDKRSTTKYHYLYHKCGRCGSYNTRQIRTFRRGEGSSAMGSASVQRGEGSSSMGSASGSRSDTTTVVSGESRAPVEERERMEVELRVETALRGDANDVMDD